MGIVQYLLNALLFVVVGLQLPVVVDALGDVPVGTLLGYAALVSLTVIVLRFAWVFAVLHAPKLIARRVSNWRGAVFLSWAGMRGVLSLAAALALPLETDAGAPFPGRDLILFLTFSVILATLVGQGLTLPLVIRVLGLEDDGIDDREEAEARIRTAQAAIVRLDELEREEWVREDTAECAACTGSARNASEHASRTAMTAPSSCAHRTTSACAAGCSMPSARRLVTSVAAARSATKSGFVSVVTSTSRISASTSDRRSLSCPDRARR
ncbi:MAG: hypothetical protein ACR2M2_02800 [Gaiellaceae bacterium]